MWSDEDYCGRHHHSGSWLYLDSLFQKVNKQDASWRQGTKCSVGGTEEHQRRGGGGAGFVGLGISFTTKLPDEESRRRNRCGEQKLHFTCHYLSLGCKLSMNVFVFVFCHSQNVYATDYC